MLKVGLYGNQPRFPGQSASMFPATMVEALPGSRVPLNNPVPNTFDERLMNMTGVPLRRTAVMPVNQAVFPGDVSPGTNFFHRMLSERRGMMPHYRAMEYPANNVSMTFGDRFGGRSSGEYPANNVSLK